MEESEGTGDIGPVVESCDEMQRSRINLHSHKLQGDQLKQFKKKLKLYADSLECNTPTDGKEFREWMSSIDFFIGHCTQVRELVNFQKKALIRNVINSDAEYEKIYNSSCSCFNLITYLISTIKNVLEAKSIESQEAVESGKAGVVRMKEAVDRKMKKLLSNMREFKETLSSIVKGYGKSLVSVPAINGLEEHLPDYKEFIHSGDFFCEILALKSTRVSREQANIGLRLHVKTWIESYTDNDTAIEKVILALENYENLKEIDEKFDSLVKMNKPVCTDDVNVVWGDGTKSKEGGKKRRVKKWRDPCVFCCAKDHISKMCTIFSTPGLRAMAILNNNLCVRCLLPNDFEDQHLTCLRIKTACQHCRGNHDMLFCEKQVVPASINDTTVWSHADIVFDELSTRRIQEHGYLGHDSPELIPEREKTPVRDSPETISDSTPLPYQVKRPGQNLEVAAPTESHHDHDIVLLSGRPESKILTDPTTVEPLSKSTEKLEIRINSQVTKSFKRHNETTIQNQKMRSMRKNSEVKSAVVVGSTQRCEESEEIQIVDNDGQAEREGDEAMKKKYVDSSQITNPVILEKKSLKEKSEGPGVLMTSHRDRQDEKAAEMIAEKPVFPDTSPDKHEKLSQFPSHNLIQLNHRAVNSIKSNETGKNGWSSVEEADEHSKRLQKDTLLAPTPEAPGTMSIILKTNEYELFRSAFLEVINQKYMFIRLESPGSEENKSDVQMVFPIKKEISKLFGGKLLQMAKIPPFTLNFWNKAKMRGGRLITVEFPLFSQYEKAINLINSVFQKMIAEGRQAVPFDFCHFLSDGEVRYERKRSKSPVEEEPAYDEIMVKKRKKHEENQNKITKNIQISD